LVFAKIDKTVVETGRIFQPICRVIALIFFFFVLIILLYFFYLYFCLWASPPQADTFLETFLIPSI